MRTLRLIRRKVLVQPIELDHADYRGKKAGMIVIRSVSLRNMIGKKVKVYIYKGNLND